MNIHWKSLVIVILAVCILIYSGLFNIANKEPEINNEEIFKIINRQTIEYIDYTIIKDMNTGKEYIVIDGGNRIAVIQR